MKHDRIATVDFEGSALNGYPIEIGIARWTIGERCYRSWSCLIAPPPRWRDDVGAWSWEADRIHRIPRADLAGGKDPETALADAIAFADGLDLFTDGFQIDLAFMEKLAQEAGLTAPRVRPASDLAREMTKDPIILMEMLRPYPGEGRSRHRAEPDAVDTLQRIAHGLGLWPLQKTN